MGATSAVRGLAQVVGMEAILLPAALVQAFGMTVLATMPGTVATKLGMAIGMIMTTSSMTTASMITSTTTSLQLESEVVARLLYGYGYGRCGWLYNEAPITGSPYWWDRYYTCVGYY
jgi:hypothetical protein